MRYIHCTDRNGKSFVVVGNFNTEDAEVTCPMPSEGTWKTLDGQTEFQNTAEITLTLPAAEYMLLVNY